jgi:hypothetical protein
MEPGQETQRWLSFKLDVKVVGLVINNKEYLGDSRVGTVSPNGIGLFIPANLKLKDVAQISFTLPKSKDVIKAKATVRNRSGFRYLFEFTEMADADREKIRVGCIVAGTSGI